MRIIELLDPEIGLRPGDYLPNHMRDRVLNGLSADSRAIQPGFLFIALPGSCYDGSTFINEACSLGAIAVIASLNSPTPEKIIQEGKVAFLRDPNPRRRLALLAARFYPTKPLKIAAVTGTNGKTSITHFLEQVWLANKRRAASLGTLGFSVASGSSPNSSSMTTPDPVTLHRIVQNATTTHHIDHLAIEASSHGLGQHRLDGLDIDYAAFTSLGHDHLDYHKTREAYGRAKLYLFTHLLRQEGTAIIASGTSWSNRVRAACQKRGIEVMSYGSDLGADIHLIERYPHNRGQKLVIRIKESQPLSLDLPLWGAFQAYNALSALGLALASGIDPDHALRSIIQLQAVPGRMDFIGLTAKRAQVIVDYAHTADALENALQGLSEARKGRIICVFGCGGDRDRKKRPIMGRIADHWAEIVIITDDNPRKENAAAIRASIRQGISASASSSTCWYEIAERRTAIKAAIDKAEPDDIILIAGKGHETFQEIGSERYPFDDRGVVREILIDTGGQLI